MRKQSLRLKFFQRQLILAISFLLFGYSYTPAKVKVATSIPDLASIAAYIGGNEVEVFSIAKANSNPHFVEVLPSYMVKVSRVDVFLKVGMSLDPWSDAIIEGSRNSKLDIVDCSVGINVLEKPVGKVDASMGDVHLQGNPHYWLDPKNSSVIAQNIRQSLSKIDPTHAELFSQNEKKFNETMELNQKKWTQKIAFLHGSSIITYHSSWVYFAKAFGFNIVGYVEPFPGIPPTAKHLQKLVEKINTTKVALLIQEPYYGDSEAQFLARKTGIKIFHFKPSCESISSNEYFQHFDSIIDALAQLNSKPDSK